MEYTSKSNLIQMDDVSSINISENNKPKSDPTTSNVDPPVATKDTASHKSRVQQLRKKQSESHTNPESQTTSFGRIRSDSVVDAILDLDDDETVDSYSVESSANISGASSGSLPSTDTPIKSNPSSATDRSTKSIRSFKRNRIVSYESHAKMEPDRGEKLIGDVPDTVPKPESLVTDIVQESKPVTELPTMEEEADSDNKASFNLGTPPIDGSDPDDSAGIPQDHAFSPVEDSNNPPFTVDTPSEAEAADETEELPTSSNNTLNPTKHSDETKDALSVIVEEGSVPSSPGVSNMEDILRAPPKEDSVAVASKNPDTKTKPPSHGAKSSSKGSFKPKLPIELEKSPVALRRQNANHDLRPSNSRATLPKSKINKAGAHNSVIRSNAVTKAKSHDHRTPTGSETTGHGRYSQRSDRDRSVPRTTAPLDKPTSLKASKSTGSIQDVGKTKPSGPIKMKGSTSSPYLPRKQYAGGHGVPLVQTSPLPRKKNVPSAKSDGSSKKSLGQKLDANKNVSALEKRKPLLFKAKQSPTDSPSSSVDHPDIGISDDILKQAEAIASGDSSSGSSKESVSSDATERVDSDSSPKDGTAESDSPSLGFDVRHDLSTRVLALSQKGEWMLVENVLRTASKKDLNLMMTDTHGFTPLMLAVKDGRTGTIERLLELGASLSDTTKDGRNLAHIAAMYSRDDTMRLLIERNIDVTSFGGPKGQLPLHMACSRPTSQVLPLVQLLLRTTNIPGKDSRLIEDRSGCIPVLYASEAGNVVVSKELLSSLSDKQVTAVRKDTGDTLLHLAVLRKELDMIRFLIDHGAIVDAQNNFGQTPLHLVAKSGEDTMLRIFFSARANANIPDKDDKTPLHIAAENGNVSMVEILADKFKSSVTARTKDGDTLMHIASSYGHPEVALAFLKRGVPLHMPNKMGALALHCAAGQGHLQTVKTLLQRGAHVDSKTKNGFTPLHVSTQNGRYNVVECLIGSGADVHLFGGNQSETALHLAASVDGADGERCASMLIKSGAELNVRNGTGEAALHIAARKGNPAMIQLLLNNDADPMATSKTGESALHVVGRYCHLAACKLILEYIEENRGRDEATMLVNLQAASGETAVHYAAEITSDMVHRKNEDSDIIKLLLEYGGDVNIPTNATNETVIHYCARVGNQHGLDEIVKKIGPGAAQIALNKQSKNGWSPLLEAADQGHVDAVAILLKHHARVDVFDELGRTALHLASEKGFDSVADVLLKHKAFINSKTKLGVTPLHLGAMHGHIELVKLLVNEHKATVDATSLENRTPLHAAAKCGQQLVCSTLLTMGANANARDSKGQTPLHLAAESDFPEVVKMFLKMKPDLSTLTATDENGFTCAHIAAMKGSVQVLRELMMIDKSMVTEAITKATESTTLHLAAAGGHPKACKMLTESGCDVTAETTNGQTCIHLAAKFGHIHVLDNIERSLWGYHSKKTGLAPLHVAAYFGQIEFVRYLLSQLPATLKSEPPQEKNPFIIKELATEYGLTPLHMAAQSGHEGLVRLLLNFQGVQVDAATATLNVISLHLAAQSGHVAVVGLLLSRSTQQLHTKDSKGRTSLHMAAQMGHHDMVSLLIGQGSNINAMDSNGWTALHFATKAGHMSVVKLLAESGADPLAETREGKVALCFAASNNHVTVLSYLIHHNHDSYLLMEDRKFIYDLMVCGKNHGYKPVEEFILVSPAPIDVAVKLSSLYRDMSNKEKERAKDLTIVSEYCEDMAVELLSITSSTYNPAILLKAVDNRNRPFLDILIENEQKRVVSHAAVQRYLTEIWNGGVTWGSSKMIVFFFVLFLCPPIWVAFCMPLNSKLCRAPSIKFICHLVSHLYFTGLLCVEVLAMYQKIYEVNSIVPNLFEWFLLLFLSGLLVAELSNPGQRTGLGIIKIVMLVISAIAVLIHVFAFVVFDFLLQESDPENRFTTLYVRNQFFAVVLLFCFVSFLDFLTVHQLFGPWAIIIGSLMFDLMRFLVILLLFILGFTLHVTSIFQPAYESHDPSDARLSQPWETLEMLFFSLFGLVEPDVMPPLHRTPSFSIAILKLVFGIYMMVTLIVLINLLIAMMSDTYQRIQAQSDMEWKFGRAKLIRSMNKKSATAVPVNIFTKFYTIMKVAVRNRCNLCSPKAQEDMRYEENIDAYAMTSDAGRRSPAPGAKHGEDEAETGQSQNGGRTGAMQIEDVINWKKIVETFHVYQGGVDDELNFDLGGNDDDDGKTKMASNGDVAKQNTLIRTKTDDQMVSYNSTPRGSVSKANFIPERRVTRVSYISSL